MKPVAAEGPAVRIIRSVVFRAHGACLLSPCIQGLNEFRFLNQAHTRHTEAPQLLLEFSVLESCSLLSGQETYCREAIYGRVHSLSVGFRHVTVW